jgi:L-lactate dehydrogenase complex protein LldF
MMTGDQLDPRTAAPFPDAALKIIRDEPQTRANVRHATDVIQAKRARVVAEMPDWQALRESGRQIREHTMRHLSAYLLQFEENCTEAGGHVHWAKDADEANRIVVRLVQEALGQASNREVLKIKSMTTEEIHLNPALEAVGIRPVETDLAELIIQLGHDQPSHIVVPALHKNRRQIREIFQREMNLPDLGETPQAVLAREVPAGRDRCERREFPDRRDGWRVHRGVGGQWANVPHASEDAGYDCGHR